MQRPAAGRVARFPWRLLVPGALILVAGLLVAGERSLEAFSRSPYPLTPVLRYEQVRSIRAPAVGVSVPARIPVEFSLRPGETLAGVLSGTFELGPTEAWEVTDSVGRHLDLRRIRAGDSHLAYVDRHSRLEAVEFFVGERGRLLAERAEDRWSSTFKPYFRRVEMRRVEGEIEDSLIAALDRSGSSPVLAFRMADVLQWDLDFNRDLRTGDRFEVLFEEVFLDGAYHSLGAILALRYQGGGRELEAYRFGDGDHDYYDGDGRPMRKMFLRSPLRFSRITSRFSRRRFHPVLKRYRPHYGVDYGAPVGTPAHVTANGVVTFAGWNRGGGKTVKVRHPNGYISAYLHLSRFAKGVRPGKRLAQGDTVGYVGSTGLATGPHLDYRVQHRGKWIDPQSLKSVSAEPIPADRFAEFVARRDAMRVSLETGTPLPASSPAVDPVLVAEEGGSTESSPVVASGK